MDLIITSGENFFSRKDYFLNTRNVFIYHVTILEIFRRKIKRVLKKKLFAKKKISGIPKIEQLYGKPQELPVKQINILVNVEQDTLSLSIGVQW